MRRVEREPHQRVGAFVGAERCAGAAHVRATPAGAHGIDHESWQRGGELLREHVERGFADGIRGRPRLRLAIQLPRAARHIDDARSGGMFQQRQQGLRHAERANEIGLERGAQRLRRKRGERTVVVEQDAGVIGQHIEPAMSLPNGFRRPMQRGVVGDIQLNRLGGAPDFLGRRLGPRQVAAGDNDLGAARGELFGGGKTDPASGSRDQNNRRSHAPTVTQVWSGRQRALRRESNLPCAMIVWTK